MEQLILTLLAACLLAVLLGMLPKGQKLFSYSLLLAFVTQIILLLNFDSIEGQKLFSLRLFEFFHTQYDLQFLFSKTNIISALFTSFVVFIVGRFSIEYLRNEKGRYRFYLQLGLLHFSIIGIIYSNNLDTTAVFWELTGITSVFLIAFFPENTRGAESAIKALLNYRFGDAFLLFAIGLTHFTDHGHPSFWVALFVVLTAFPKSGIIPFSAWLKRSIEGPSASTALYYGALAINLGPFLLLKYYDIWAQFKVLNGITIGLGITTAVFASLQASTRSDAKSALILASQSQTALIIAEIGMGFTDFAVLHLVLHMGFRIWQILKASNLVQDFQENPVLFHTYASRHNSFGFSNKTFYSLSQNFFYIEDFLEFLISQIKRVVGLFTLSSRLTVLSVSLFLTLLLMIDLNFVIGMILFALIMNLVIGLKSLYESSLTKSLLYFCVSQIGHLLLGLAYSKAPFDLFFYSLLLEMICIVCVCYFVIDLCRTHKLNSFQKYQGLMGLYGNYFPVFAAVIMATVGVPFFASFGIEEVTFHRVASQSVPVMGLIVFIVGINLASGFKLLFRIFWGIPQEGTLRVNGFIAKHALMGCIVLGIHSLIAFVHFLKINRFLG